MKTFRYQVILTVEVEAFDESDAFEALDDNFGVGEYNGLEVVEREYQ